MVVNSDMVFNTMVGKTEIFYFAGYLFLLKFIEIAFIGTVFAISIISSHLTTESPTIIFKYLSVSPAHVLGFQT